VGFKSFQVAVSLPLTAAQLTAVVRRLIGGGRRVDDRDDSSEANADVVTSMVVVDDPGWPRLFECWSEAGLEELGPYPDLRFAVELWRSYGADCYCDFYPFADDGLHPRDQRRFLACVRGQWWLATVDVPRLSGGEKVRLVRPVELPAGVAPDNPDWPSVCL
jgi:hypothetical protein